MGYCRCGVAVACGLVGCAIGYGGERAWSAEDSSWRNAIPFAARDGSGGKCFLFGKSASASRTWRVSELAGFLREHASMRRARMESGRNWWYPTLAPGKRRKDGARIICGSTSKGKPRLPRGFLTRG